MLIYPWLSLIPPLIVVFAGFFLKDLTKALLLGIIIAIIIATNGSLGDFFPLFYTRIYEQISNSNNLYLYGFLFFIAFIVIIINRSTGPQAFVAAMSSRIRKASTVEYMSVFSSCALCIDDYLSILTVGHVLRGVTDHFNIPREKLAFFIHALAGSIVVLLPISSWVAAITGYLSQAGITTLQSDKTVFLIDPFFVYLRTIPFMFYSFIIFFSILFLIKKRIAYGSIGHLEKAPISSSPHSSDYILNPNARVIDLFLPIGMIICSVFVSILYIGNCWIFGGTTSILESFKKNEDIFLILFIATLLSLIVTIVFGFIRKSLQIKTLPLIFREGYLLMKDAVVMVILASILGSLLKNDLMTGNYVAQLILHSIPLSLLPFIFFVTSLICTLATGAAWGTFAFMTAIAIPMLVPLFSLITPASSTDAPLLYPLLGAIFSGAICGDHISPFSETTIMAAKSTEISPFRHVSSQISYAIPAILGSAVSFFCVGFLITYSWKIQTAASLAIGLAISFGLMLILNTKNSDQIKQN